MKIVHIITSLGVGGAESTLYQLIRNDQSNTHSVLCLTNGGKHLNLLLNIGIDVTTVDFSRPAHILRSLIILTILVKKKQPDLIQSWMYHADLLAGIVGILLQKPVLWCIRNGSLDNRYLSKSTILVAKLCAMLSSFVPAYIVSCSEESIARHCLFGYKQSRFFFIPNGYDIHSYSPRPQSRLRLRQQWSVGPDVPLIGMIARYDASKDHPTMISALSLLKESRPFFRIVLVGPGIDSSNSVLVSLLTNNNLNDHCILLGTRNDIPEILNALDLTVLSSISEAFPNVIAESMSCGTPCVATDVGDTSRIMSGLGWLVPPSDPVQLASAIDQAIQEWSEQPHLWKDRKLSVRRRISSTYKISDMTSKYRYLWSTLHHSVNPRI